MLLSSSMPAIAPVGHLYGEASEHADGAHYLEILLALYLEQSDEGWGLRTTNDEWSRAALPTHSRDILGICLFSVLLKVEIKRVTRPPIEAKATNPVVGANQIPRPSPTQPGAFRWRQNLYWPVYLTQPHTD